MKQDIVFINQEVLNKLTESIISNNSRSKDLCLSIIETVKSALHTREETDYTISALCEMGKDGITAWDKLKVFDV